MMYMFLMFAIFTKQNVVALVDDIKITKQMLSEGESLNKVIDDILIYKYGLEKGYLDSVKKESDYYRFVTVLSTSYQKYVMEKAKPNEGEIYAFYRNNDREIMISMVDCKSFRDAMKAFREILRGTSWENIVNKYGQDIGLMKRGGKVGPIRWRYYPDMVTRKAFKMQKGEISFPFRENNKWYIIRIDEIRERDIKEYNQEKRIIEGQIINEKSQYLAKKHLDYLMNILNIRYDEKALKEFFDIIPKGKVREPYIFPEEFYPKVIARTRIGNVTYKDMQIFTVEDGRPPIVNKIEDLKNYISRKMVQKMLYREGLKYGFDRNFGNYEKILKNDISLVKGYIRKMEWEKIPIPDDSLREYFNANKEKFLQPEKRKVSLIQMKDLKELEKVRKMALSKKYKFSELAKKYSEHFSRDKGGDLGEILKETYPDIGRYAFGLKKGDISDCFQKFDGSWAIVKVVDIIPPKVPEFESVKTLVLIEYKDIFFERLRKELVDEMKKRTKIKILKKEEL